MKQFLCCCFQDKNFWDKVKNFDKCHSWENFSFTIIQNYKTTPSEKNRVTFELE